MSQDSRFYGVLSHAIDSVWPEVEPLIKLASDRTDRYTPEDIKRALKERDMQLWVSMCGHIEACCVTQIAKHPRKKVCFIYLVAGKGRDNWLHFLPIIEEWAKEQGCEEVEGFCRPGWERVLKDFEKSSVVMRKRLNGLE